MQYLEKKAYPIEIRKIIKQRSAILTGTAQAPGMTTELKNDPWIAALLADSHILANSKGQYLQTMYSEKVEAGTPATGESCLVLLCMHMPVNVSLMRCSTGNRFKFEGVYNSLGQRQGEFLVANTPEWNLMAYAATSLAMQVHTTSNLMIFM